MCKFEVDRNCNFYLGETEEEALKGCSSVESNPPPLPPPAAPEPPRYVLGHRKAFRKVHCLFMAPRFFFNFRCIPVPVLSFFVFFCCLSAKVFASISTF